jgi:hypothetical protein
VVQFLNPSLLHGASNAPVVITLADNTDQGNVYQECNTPAYGVIPVGIQGGQRKDAWLNGTHVVYSERNHFGTRPGQAFHQYSASVSVTAGPGQVVLAVIAHQNHNGLEEDKVTATHLQPGQAKIFPFPIPPGSNAYNLGGEACVGKAA